MPQKKSEQILLIALGGIVVLYLVYTFLLTGDGESIDPDKVINVNWSELNATVDMAEQLANKDPFTPLEQEKLERAEQRWPNDPFYDRVKFARQDQQQKEQELTSAEDLNLAYTGYVTIDEDVFAVINGFEYEPGEEIVTAEGFYISAIDPQSVIIGQKNATGEIVEQFIIPIAEDPLNLYN